MGKEHWKIVVIEQYLELLICKRQSSLSERKSSFSGFSSRVGWLRQAPSRQQSGVQWMPAFLLPHRFSHLVEHRKHMVFRTLAGPGGSVVLTGVGGFLTQHYFRWGLIVSLTNQIWVCRHALLECWAHAASIGDNEVRVGFNFGDRSYETALLMPV